MTLPDCAICGGPVEVEPSGDRGPVEECRRCGNAQRMPTPRIDRGQVRRLARQVVAAARREGLPPLRCPSCKRGRCDNCHVITCECTDSDHPRRPDAQARPAARQA